MQTLISKEKNTSSTVLSEEKKLQMVEFFMKYSIPRILEEEEEEIK